MDDLANTGGRVLGGLLSANEIYHGGLMRYLANRQQLLQDPSLRGSLGPFGAGLLQVGGSQVPQSATGEAERAGVSPEQAAQMGVQIVGPSPTFGGAVDPRGSRFVPNLPPLGPEAQVEQQLARSELGLLRQPGMAAQAARSKFGIRPSPLEGMEGIIKALGGSTEGLELKQIGPQGPVFVPSGQGDLQQTNVPGLLRAGSRFVRDPRVPAAKAGGGGGEELLTQARQFDPRRLNAIAAGALRDPQISAEQAKALLQQSRESKAADAAERTRQTDAVKQLALTNTTKTMVEAAPKVLHFIDRIQRDLADIETGPFASRYQEFMAGRIGAPNPAFTRYRTNVGLLSTLLLRMHVGARGGQQMFEHFQGLVNSGTQSAANMRAALDAIRDYATDVAAARTNAPPESRLGPRAPAAPEMQTTPGGNNYRVLGE